MSHYTTKPKSRRPQPSTHLPSSSHPLPHPAHANANPRALTEDQRGEIREAFDLFDVDKDGAIDYHEFKVAMRALGFDVKKGEVMKLLKEFGGEDGLMDFVGFERISGSLSPLLPSFSPISSEGEGAKPPAVTEKILSRNPEHELRRAFELFDDDRSGKISLKNLRRVAKELGETLGEDELQAMIDEFDLDQDGEINLEEFLAIMLDGE
ncbi:EF-hand calcium-binding protein [Cryptococcus wingfieldii CBS 7118]|uniref:EF-hand calcium-binding protein n=1 Tax=Cryptococcus wingfieldii CBS 7118 TaxID=1295528 RepID=A0A1E3IDV8_9TREE|nr:EF-hand calcium-binding protein [Cryptococcus wingfieldii CBS 7118]ODN86812.1 EF-hand calcium-binding protein [Cryptococcus wingfieldii CBS 7118]